MFDIISIGSATQDIFLASSHFKKVADALSLTLGSKFTIEKIAKSGGGGAANVATTFARQGLKTACVSVVGNDLEGNAIIDEMNREGISTDFMLRHSDDFTGYSVILVDESGERVILSYKGEGIHFNSVAIPFEKIETSWMYLNTVGGNYKLLCDTIEWGKKQGIKMVTNPSVKELELGKDKLVPLFENFAIVGMNQDEVAGLTGLAADQEAPLLDAFDEMVGGIAIMTKGPDGVVVSDGVHRYRAAVPTSPVVERTGAGDAFHSGFAAEYIRSHDIPTAIQYATANASSVVAQFGAHPGILKKGEWGPWPKIDVVTES